MNRIVRSHVSSASDAAASLMAEMALSVPSQAAFALPGLALLYAIGTMSALGTQLLVGVATMIVLGAGFIVAQRAGALGTLVGTLNRLVAGELWIALRFLGEPRDILDEIALEALIQAVSSLAFFVPAALGVQ